MASYKLKQQVKVRATGKTGEVVWIDPTSDPVYYTVVIEGNESVYPEAELVEAE